MQRCGVIILAAGASSRLGRPKQLLAADGRPLLAHVTRIALDSRAHPVVVVLGALALDCGAVLAGLPVRIVKNPDWREGVASSLRAGVAALRDEDVDGVVILLCDQPMISAAFINELISTGSHIAASAYEGTTGPPVFFTRRYFDELLALRGDRGGKELLGRYPHEVTSVAFAGGGFDIDTPADYKRFVTSALRPRPQLV